MKAARILGFAAFVCALAVASVAIAAGTLNVTNHGAAVVTYPHPAQFTVKWSEPASEPINVQVRYAGGDWRTFRTISATRAVESTKPATVTLAKPSADFEIRAVQGALESAIATGGVRSTLVASARSSFRVNKPVVIKGSIMPTQAVGAPVTVKVWKQVVTRSWSRHNGHWSRKPVVTRVLVGQYPGAVTASSRNMSLWRASFTMTVKGNYEARVFFDDATHSPAASRLIRFKVK